MLTPCWPSAGPTGGADISHRGGKPGFVRAGDNGTLSFPDFSGNGHFNTFGNLEVCDRAGLLFVDFTTGDVLQLTGGAEVVWEGQELEVMALTSAFRSMYEDKLTAMLILD